MQELFRFFAVRAASPLSADDHIALDQPTDFQARLRGSNVTAETAVAYANEALRTLDAEVSSEGDQLRTMLEAIRTLVETSELSDAAAPITQWVESTFQRPLSAVAKMLTEGTSRLKDALVALRVLRTLQKRGPRVVVAPIAPTTLSKRVSLLIEHLRVRILIERAAAAPLSFVKAKEALKIPITYEWIGKIIEMKEETAKTPAGQLATHRKHLARLVDLIIEVRAARFGGLVVKADGSVVLASASATDLASRYKSLLAALDGLDGPSIPQDLGNGWLELHAMLEAKAKTLQKLVDVTVPQAAATTPGGASPTVAGHLQLAGVADVHVVLNHVVRYERAEIAHVENVMRGETRNRKYRTLLRNEADTETVNETVSTEEREVKTEDRSSLKVETTKALKEVLDVKAGIDFQYKQGDSLKLGINASVAYTRTKDETNKVATEFAKEITNRAAEKIVETARASARTKVLRETEEVVEHIFANNTVSSGDHVTGVYQWIEKVYEHVHLTVGGPAAIFDGVILQPARRLLSAPVSADGALEPATAPPPLDFAAEDIHPWNYLALASRFGAAGVAAPPPFVSTACYSGAASGTAEQGIAQDIAIPEDTTASFAHLVFAVQDNDSDQAEDSIACVSLGSRRIEGDTSTRHTTFNGKVVLDNERALLPFAAFFYKMQGFECTIDVFCIRSDEAYGKWQLGVHAALAAARAQAQQAYEERLARASLQKAYDFGPSPGRAEQLIREEIKRCAIGVLAKQSGGKNIFERLEDSYAAGQGADVARLCLLYEHAFAWENMSYVLYPYFWADNRDDGWKLHTSRSEGNEAWAEFLRAGAARVVVPVRDGFVKMASLGVTAPGEQPSAAALQLLEEDVTPILEGTLSLDDLLSISSSKAISLAKEEALRAQVMDEWTEQEHWFLRTPTELVVLRPLSEPPLPEWKWNTAVDFKEGTTKAWQDKQS